MLLWEFSEIVYAQDTRNDNLPTLERFQDQCDSHIILGGGEPYTLSASSKLSQAHSPMKVPAD